MKQNTNNIRIVLGKDAPVHSISLRNVREVDGHDDSLPYKADVYVNRHVVAELFNDGWGGDTDVTVCNGYASELLKRIHHWVTDNYAFEYKDNHGEIVQYPLDLGYVFDTATHECLDGATCIHISKLDGVGRKKKGA